MDTITHALSGALLARATAAKTPRDGEPDLARRTLTGALAAAFPDVDYVLSWVDPLIYLNLHRGHTHSLVLLPLWALLLAWLLRHAWRRRFRLRPLYGICALGITAHIAGDIITVYGTRIFVPLSNQRVTLPTTFIIDLIFTGIIVTGLVLSRFAAPRRSARLALLVLFGYVGLQAFWHHQALAVAQAWRASQVPGDAPVYALPQPLSPLHWKLMVVDGETYHQAYLKLYGEATAAGPGDGWLRRLAAVYRPSESLCWTRVQRFGAAPAVAARARAAWNADEFREFREFAVFPALYRIDRRAPDGECIWFTDLRFAIEERTPPFRYGLCRSGGWSGIERLAVD